MKITKEMQEKLDGYRNRFTFREILSLRWDYGDDIADHEKKENIMWQEHRENNAIYRGCR